MCSMWYIFKKLRALRIITAKLPESLPMRNVGATHENLDQKVYTILKKMITDRKLLPGRKIPQEKLAGELGISRTPLVNALKYLEISKESQALSPELLFGDALYNYYSVWIPENYPALKIILMFFETKWTWKWLHTHISISYYCWTLWWTYEYVFQKKNKSVLCGTKL